jgi:helicase
MDPVHFLAIETIQKKKQAIIFCPSRASTEKTAEDISKKLTSQNPILAEQALGAVSSPTKQCTRLANCLKKGIAFHHAGLVAKQRELIEEEFKSGQIKVICATPTLAIGVDLPAFRVIIKSLKRFSGRWGMAWIPVLEYLQMAGRAGRPKYETFGESVVLARNDAEKSELYDRYICGVPEEIYSKLAVEPVLRTYLLSLIASRVIRDKTSMLEFFGKTFWAHQFEDMEKLKEILERMLRMLEKWQFVKVEGLVNNENFVSARYLQESKVSKMNVTILGKRVSELYIDPLTARHLLDCLTKFETMEEKESFSILQMVCHTLEMRPLLSVKAREQDKTQMELLKNYDYLLEKEPSAFDLEYADFINSIKTTTFFSAWIDEQGEDSLLETFGIRPGEIKVKLDTAEWLLYASSELALIQNLRETTSYLTKLRLQVKHGAREELLPLLQLKGIGRKRARKLHHQGIKHLADLKKMDPTSVTQILGAALGQSILKQVGVEIKHIPKGTRKGQLSINKF